jgi:hypothetical protein
MGKAASQPSETDKNIDTSKLDLTDNKKVDNDATLKCNCEVEIDPTNDDENSSTESVEANLQNIEDKDDSDASSSEVTFKKYQLFCANHEDAQKQRQKFWIFKMAFFNWKYYFFDKKN